MFRSGREFAAWLGLPPRATQAAAKTGWDEYPSVATATSGTCSMLAQAMLSALPRRERQAASMDPSSTGSTATKGRDHCAHQQDGAHHAIDWPRRIAKRRESRLQLPCVHFFILPDC